jgi:hypothetical protein
MVILVCLVLVKYLETIYQIMSVYSVPVRLNLLTIKVLIVYYVIHSNLLIHP